jgi:hypothetical protein
MAKTWLSDAGGGSCPAVPAGKTPRTRCGSCARDRYARSCWPRPIGMLLPLSTIHATSVGNPFRSTQSTATSSFLFRFLSIPATNGRVASAVSTRLVGAEPAASLDLVPGRPAHRPADVGHRRPLDTHGRGHQNRQRLGLGLPQQKRTNRNHLRDRKVATHDRLPSVDCAWVATPEPASALSGYFMPAQKPKTEAGDDSAIGALDIPAQPPSILLPDRGVEQLGSSSGS